MKKRDRELRRDEVFIGGTNLPQEWARDNVYVGYRILRNSGWLGRLYVGAAILFMLFGALFGLHKGANWIILVLWGLGFSVFVVGAARAMKRRRKGV